MLISKKKQLISPKNYRPISLCNVNYKIISKVLANRLKKLLPEIIDESQSAFVKGRMIFDNIMVAHETVHSMQKKRKGKIGYMASKLDMTKAYDKVEWDFLEGIMKKMGFASRWVSLVMPCVRLVSYSIVINGKQGGDIVPTRGLRQGDPLSPYIFLLYAEGLVGLI